MIRYLIDTDISSYFLKKRYPSLDRRMRAALMANAVDLRLYAVVGVGLERVVWQTVAPN